MGMGPRKIIFLNNGDNTVFIVTRDGNGHAITPRLDWHLKRGLTRQEYDAAVEFLKTTDFPVNTTMFSIGENKNFVVM